MVNPKFSQNQEAYVKTLNMWLIIIFENFVADVQGDDEDDDDDDENDPDYKLPEGVCVMEFNRFFDSD